MTLKRFQCEACSSMSGRGSARDDCGRKSQGDGAVHDPALRWTRETCLSMRIARDAGGPRKKRRSARGRRVGCVYSACGLNDSNTAPTRVEMSAGYQKATDHQGLLTADIEEHRSPLDKNMHLTPFPALPRPQSPIITAEAAPNTAQI